MQSKSDQAANSAGPDSRLVSSADPSPPEDPALPGMDDCSQRACTVPDVAAKATASGSQQESAGESVPKQSGNPPVALVVVAHTPLASALRDIARHVFGHDAPITAIDVLPGACAEDSSGAMLNQLKVLNQGSGVLMMTDLPGASPCNVCTSAAEMAREQGIPCEVITGVNAAMVLRAISYREQDIMSLAQQVIEGASKTVMRVD
ncbi:PTS sugar transporter subunit IIA [Orrella marina]|nr:PTS sugar transporter subunit IIA [Orrella marina]